MTSFRSSESVSSSVYGGEGAVGVETRDFSTSSYEGDAYPLKADSDISESGDSSLFCH